MPPVRHSPSRANRLHYRRAAARSQARPDRNDRTPDHVLGGHTQKMIPRYSRPQMAALWTDEAKWERWLQVEIAVVRAWAEEGVVPAADAELIARNARVVVANIDRYQQESPARHPGLPALHQRSPGAGGALGAPRPHQQRRLGHGHGTALARRGVATGRRPPASARRARAPGTAPQGHPNHGTHARRARGGHHVRPQTGRLGG